MDCLHDASSSVLSRVCAPGPSWARGARKSLLATTHSCRPLRFFRRSRTVTHRVSRPGFRRRSNDSCTNLWEFYGHGHRRPMARSGCCDLALPLNGAAPRSATGQAAGCGRGTPPHRDCGTGDKFKLPFPVRNSARLRGSAVIKNNIHFAG